MRGIRTYFRHSSESDSGFRQSYRCLYPLFDGLYLVEAILDSCFHFPWDDDTAFDEFSKAYGEIDGNDALYDASVLIANDQHVSDDWNSIVLIDVVQLTANRTLANHVRSSALSSSESRDNRIIFFHNFDGAFWQFFTNDDRFITAMLEAQRDNHDLDLRKVAFSQDYPDPGKYRDDYPPAA